VVECLRRRHDRAHRLLLGLLRDARLRSSLDARTDFPYRQFYPRDLAFVSRRWMFDPRTLVAARTSTSAS